MFFNLARNLRAFSFLLRLYVRLRAADPRQRWLRLCARNSRSWQCGRERFAD